MNTLPLALMLAIAAAPAAASTPAAWAAGNAAARVACLKASGLLGAVASRPILFGDATGAKTAMLVTGRYDQAFMKGQKGQFLCLYDRRTRRAETSEAPGWSAP